MNFSHFTLMPTEVHKALLLSGLGKEIAVFLFRTVECVAGAFYLFIGKRKINKAEKIFSLIGCA